MKLRQWLFSRYVQPLVDAELSKRRIIVQYQNPEGPVHTVLDLSILAHELLSRMETGRVVDVMPSFGGFVRVRLEKIES